MQRLLDRTKIVLASALLPAIVFLSFPPPIIEANATEIAFNRRVLYLVWLLFFVSSAVFAAVALMSSDRPRRLFLAALTASAVNVLLWNAAFPYFWLNSATAMWGAVAIEITIFAVCVWAAAKLPYPLVLLASALLTVLTAAFAIPDHFGLARTLPEQGEQSNGPHRADTPAPLPADIHVTGNVYHIVLDAFASPYMVHLVKKGDVDLSGYTFYPKATANYGRTNLSMRSVFTGAYHPDHIGDWESAFRTGFTSSLADNSVDMNYFPFYPWYCPQKASICRGTIDIYGFYRKHIGMTFVSDIVFQSMLPLSVRDYLLESLEHDDRPKDTWEYGFSITSWVLELFENSEGFPKWRQPIQSFTMDTVDDFLETEEGLPPAGRYVYLHVMAPHDPYVFSSDCKFVAPHERKLIAGAIEDQFDCAVTVIKKITQRLRELGRFDNSLVVIHADHGLGFSELLHQWDPTFTLDASAQNLNRNTDNLALLPSQWVAGVAGSLFLIHRPGQADYNATQQEAQLIDVAPTVLDFFHLDHSAYPGVSLLSSTPPSGREVIYFESNTDILADLKRLAKFVREDGQWEFRSWESTIGTDTDDQASMR